MKVSIIGGGIGGLCTAIALQKNGFDATVYEKAEVFKPLGAGIALAANAIKGLKAIGIADAIIKRGKLIKYLSILDERGKSIISRDTSIYSDEWGLDNFAIHRAVLHEVLIEHLLPNTYVLGSKCVGVTQQSNSVLINMESGEQIESDCVIAADGVHSPIRQQLLPQASKRYGGYTCWRAVVDGKDFNPDVFSETWGPQGRFGIVPLTDNKIYWFACVNAPEGDREMKTGGIKELLECFKQYHAPIPQLITSTKQEQLIHNDIIDIKPINQYAFGNIVLIGDAAHATTPNMGQGACQAIEDAVFLTNFFKRYNDPKVAFKKFEEARIKRTTAIVNKSWSMGKMAQLSNPLLCKMRNAALRLVPDSVGKKQLAFLYDVDFGKL